MGGCLGCGRGLLSRQRCVRLCGARSIRLRLQRIKGARQPGDELFELVNACGVKAMDVIKDAPRKIGLLEQGGRGRGGPKTLNLGASSPGAERGRRAPNAGRGRRREGSRGGCGNSWGSGWSGTRQPLLKGCILCDDLAPVL